MPSYRDAFGFLVEKEIRPISRYYSVARGERGTGAIVEAIK
jgi:hypothetical protein